MSELVVIHHRGGVWRALLRLSFILTHRNKWRDEMIRRSVARYNWQTRKW